MKAFITLLFVIVLGIFSTQAQDANTSAETKVSTITTTVITTTSENTLITLPTTVKANENSVARLYMFKNSRVKKALSFKTKRSKSKLA